MPDRLSYMRGRVTAGMRRYVVSIAAAGAAGPSVVPTAKLVALLPSCIIALNSYVFLVAGTVLD